MNPVVLSELETLERVRSGRCSLARIGDGELTIALMGGWSPSQEYDKGLAKRLRQIAASDDPNLVVAIPRIYESIPRHMERSWKRWATPERASIFWGGRTFGSAFVTRPDFYGKPFGMPYWATFRSIWEGRPVLVVTGGRQNKAGEFFNVASKIDRLEAPWRDAWAAHKGLLADCLAWAKVRANRDGLVAMMIGATATVLAADLCARGVQALDVGKAHRFYHLERRDAA